MEAREWRETADEGKIALLVATLVIAIGVALVALPGVPKEFGLGRMGLVALTFGFVQGASPRRRLAVGGVVFAVLSIAVAWLPEGVRGDARSVGGAFVVLGLLGIADGVRRLRHPTLLRLDEEGIGGNRMRVPYREIERAEVYDARDGRLGIALRSGERRGTRMRVHRWLTGFDLTIGPWERSGAEARELERLVNERIAG